MKIEKSETNGVSTLKLIGELDLHAVPELRAQFLAFASAKTPVVLVDFSDATYIDSSGLAVLIEYFKESATFGGKLGLFGLQKKVLAVFQLVRLDRFFSIAEDAPAVLARLGC